MALLEIWYAQDIVFRLRIYLVVVWRAAAQAAGTYSVL